MPALPYRLVVDTNVLLRGLINIHSASGQIVDACDKRAVLILLSKPGGATYIVSMDKDLLSLPTGHDDAAKRFRQRLPAVKVLDPYEFVLRHGRELGPR